MAITKSTLVDGKELQYVRLYKKRETWVEYLEGCLSEDFI